jgi:SAM-dependent methyltransferase
MSEEKSYVIGTHDAEIERLGLQHRVWRPSVLEFWRLAGLTHDMTVIDAGAGPGYAACDLAEIVGANGRVIAVERSHRFVRALQARAKAQGISNIGAVESDLLDYAWPSGVADRVWCRWVLAFVSDREKVLRSMAKALKPGGALMLHEYYDYASWHLAPRSVEFEAYVAKIIASWRTSGGEPDIGLALPHLLTDLGLEIELVRPQVFAAHPDDFVWQWPTTFARSNAYVMAENGTISRAEAERIDTILAQYESDPVSLVITPGVLQIVARKPA